MSKKFCWVYIGAGSIAQQTAKEILPTNRHRIISVYNRTFSKAEEFAHTFGALPCRTIAEAISVKGADAAYIATTNNNHYAAARECLLAGIPVLIEKPFTVNTRESEELINIAKRRGLYLAEAMWTWFSPVARQVKTWFTNGETGCLKHIEISYVNRVSHLYPRLFEPSLGGGALLDIGVYPLTYLYNLLGYPDSIKCEGVVENGIDTEENITFSYNNAAGTTGKIFQVTAEVSIVKSPGYENLVITGTEGRIECPDYHMASKATMVNSSGESIFEGNGRYDNQFDIVADEIMRGKKESEYVPLNATLDVMKIMDECRRQMGLRYPFE